MQPQLLTVIKLEQLKAWSPEEWKQWVVEPKYDGARLIYHKGQFLSRTGKPLHNLDHIAEELSQIPAWWTLDGEIHGENWAETMSVARASKTVKTNSLRFSVFEVMTNDEWENQISNADDLIARREKVFNLLSQHAFQFVQPVGFQACHSYDDFMNFHRIHLHMGCDGTVLKKIDSLYEFRRTKTWLKVKPIETFDAKVVGYKTGTGKYAGVIGALDIIPEGVGGVHSWCSGMTDAQRREWMDADKIVGKTIEVQARGVHPSGCLIEPRFIRIREDK